MVSPRHPSDSQLLAFQDHELRFWRAWSLRRHIQHCWVCRGKIAGIENAIRKVGEAMDGPRSITAVELARAKWRFREAAATYEAVHTPRWRFRIAWAGVPAVAAFLGWMMWTPSPRRVLDPPAAARIVVDPFDSIVRAESPASASVRQDEFSIEIQRPGQNLVQRKWELWSAPAQGRYASRWQDPAGKLLNAVFASERSSSEVFDETLGLRTAVLHRGKRTQLLNGAVTAGNNLEAMILAWIERQVWEPVSLAREAAEFCSANGAKLRLSRSGEVLRWEADAQVRGRTVHVVLQALEGRAPTLLEVSWDSAKLRLTRVRMRNGVALSEAETYLSAGMRRPNLPTPPPAQSPDPAGIELEVLSTLHRNRLCRTDAVQVVSDSDGTHLIAPLLNGAQREQVRSMLPESVDIRSELPRRQGVAPNPVATSEPVRRAAAEDWLKYRLRTNQREMFDLMNVLVRESEEMSASSWAVLNLAERFPVSREHVLTDEARADLRTMAAEHADEVARSLATIGAVLTSLEVRLPDPPASTVVPGSHWQPIAKDVNGLARRSSELLLHFFAAGEPAEIGSTPEQSELPALLSELRGKLAQFRKALQN